jgi:glutamate 5-kinase
MIPEEARTIVVKIGSAVLIHQGQRVDREVFCRLVAEISSLCEAGHRVILVSSGAVAIGRRKMGITQRPQGERHIPRLQALAALGQSRLIRLYEDEFSHYDRQIAQLLLTREDFNDRRRYLNVRNALEAIHGFGVVPIINENDSIASDEIRFGDNDQLAALVATMVQADQLVILSDIDGFYTANPKLHPDARRLAQLYAEDPALDNMISDITDARGFGSGGMTSKLSAARLAARTGITTIIAPGKRAGVLADVLGPAPSTGTRLLPAQHLDSLAARKAWISMGSTPRGWLRCDRGATRAVKQQGRSLLPSGVTEVQGNFREGDVVQLLTPQGEPFARGIALYPMEDMRAIMGQQSSQIETTIGYHTADCVVHRDDLALDIAPDDVEDLDSDALR